jgi:16S rRNA C1402 (ribose-2'-O) methylase RsmI
MKSYFQERGFRGEEIDKKIEEVSKITRDEALEHRKKEDKKRVPFVLTFHSNLRQLAPNCKSTFIFSKQVTD